MSTWLNYDFAPLVKKMAARTIKPNNVKGTARLGKSATVINYKPDNFANINVQHQG
jgi:hypothetical protein